MLSLTSDHLIWQKNIIYNFTVIYISLSRFGCHCCSLSHGFLTCSTHISKRKIWHSSEHQCTTSQLDAHYCNCITQALLFGLFEAFKFYTIVILSTYTRHSHTHSAFTHTLMSWPTCLWTIHLLFESISTIKIQYFLYYSNLYNIYIYFLILYITCPPCPDSGGRRVRVGYSFFRVLRVPCLRVRWIRCHYII